MKLSEKEQNIKKGFVKRINLEKVYDAVIEVTEVFSKKELTPFEAGIVIMLLDDTRRDIGVSNLLAHFESNSLTYNKSFTKSLGGYE